MKHFAAILIFLYWPVVVTAQQSPPTPVFSAEVQVYKKWIGAAGDEADAEVHLHCDYQQAIGQTDGQTFAPRWVNKDKIVSWQVSAVPEQGMMCTVSEIELETFIADIEDCRQLLVLPNDQVECTIVNTKLVKRIDMLNLYGRIIMIAVMLGAGLVATRKFTAHQTGTPSNKDSAT